MIRKVPIFGKPKLTPRPKTFIQFGVEEIKYSRHTADAAAAVSH
jgi:hypothetical protein